MENTIKNWKLLKSGVNVVDAIETIETQTYQGTKGDYAIKSERTGRFLTALDKKNERMSIPEIEGEWMILIPDDTKEKMTNEMAQLLKRSNWTGLTYQHIDNLHLPKMWEYVSEKIGSDEKLIYKTMKWFFENEIYKNK